MRWMMCCIGAALVLLTSSGCQMCEALSCGLAPPAVSVRIIDGFDGGVIHTAVVNGFPFDCPTAYCSVPLPDGGMPAGAGPVSIVVSAPGYMTAGWTEYVSEIDVSGCCGLDYQPRAEVIALYPPPP